MGPPIKPPGGDTVDYFGDWLATDGGQWWLFWEHIRRWWEIRDLPNVLLVHFNDLKQDLPGQIRRVADFLEIDVPRDRWDAVVEHCTFDWMKRHAERSAPLGGIFWDGGAATFINKGSNGRWREVLSPEDVAAYERKATQELEEACAQWLQSGNEEVPASGVAQA